MGVLEEFLEEKVFNDETKAKLVKGLNDKIDIPFISEKTEGKIIEAVYETVEACVKKAIMK